MIKIFNRYDYTPAASAFIINYCIKNNDMALYERLTLKQVHKHIKKDFKMRMDKCIYKNTNFLDVAKQLKRILDNENYQDTKIL